MKEKVGKGTEGAEIAKVKGLLRWH